VCSPFPAARHLLYWQSLADECRGEGRVRISLTNHLPLGKRHASGGSFVLASRDKGHVTTGLVACADRC
jgi:hypothetical protein